MVLISLSALAQRSVTLTCQDSPDKAANPTLGYNFYRAQVSGGPYVLISTSPQATCSFVDNNVQVGQTYFYMATAVLNGTESQYSNEANVKVLPQGHNVRAMVGSVGLLQIFAVLVVLTILFLIARTAWRRSKSTK